MRTRSAFTLVEMLVVIGILVVLAALLFASFGPVREKARQRTCASNLHQWGTAYAMYIADYDGQEATKGIPMTNAQLGLPPGSYCIGFAKQYHLINTAVMVCPSAHYPAGKYANPPQCSYDDNTLVDNPAGVAQWGSEYALMICNMHNADTDFEKQPSWATKSLQVLHLNQQVKFKTVPVHTYGE